MRKHAAIMFTDIIGFTALMGTDENYALAVLKKNREIHLKCIEAFDGNLIKEMGDGMLISFDLASDAVRCAIEIQKECKNQHIPLKIGIHEGEMVFEGSDVLGDGVNIASRIQDNTGEGQITISESVFHDIRNKREIKTRFLEEKNYKNVLEPIRIYCVYSDDLEVEIANIPPSISSGEVAKQSIVVLPFVNMSNDQEQEYFCDGMTEEIITTLSHVERLKVIARTTSFMFKGRNEDVRNIGKQLNVGVILEGSVRMAGSRIRITAQLIQVVDGAHIWSEKYDRDLEDIFTLQDEISLAIVDALKVKLIGREKAAIVKRHTNNLEAYNLYLKGIYCARLFTPQGFQEGMDYFHKSIEKDSNFALPYYGIAYIFIKITFFGNMAPHKGYQKALEYINRALDIDDYLAEVHATYGIYIENIYHWKWKEAEEECKKALLINPNCPEAHQLYSYILTFSNRHEESIQHAQMALDLDPLSNTFNSFLGAAYLYGHQIEKAIGVLEEAKKISPNDFLTCYHLGHAYELKERYQEAIFEYEKAVEVSGRSALAVSVLGGCHFLNNNIELAEKLNQELMERSKSEYIPATMIYAFYKIKDDLDEAYKWLEKAVKEHDSFLLWFTICPSKGHTIPDEPRFNLLINDVISGRDEIEFTH